MAEPHVTSLAKKFMKKRLSGAHEANLRGQFAKLSFNLSFQRNSQNTIQTTDLPHLPDHRQHGLHQQSPNPFNRTCCIPFNLPQDHHHPLTPTSIIRQGDTTAALSQQQMFLIGQLRGLAHEFALNHIWAYSGESLKTCDMLMILLQMIVIMVMVVTMELIFPHQAPFLLGGQRRRSCVELEQIAKIRAVRNRCDSLSKRGKVMEAYGLLSWKEIDGGTCESMEKMDISYLRTQWRRLTQKGEYRTWSSQCSIVEGCMLAYTMTSKMPYRECSTHVSRQITSTIKYLFLP